MGCVIDRTSTRRVIRAMPAEMRIRLLKKIFSTVDFERWDHFWSAAGERRGEAPMVVIEPVDTALPLADNPARVLDVLVRRAALR